jgi:O-antigen/teichoic acid export membrane protein
MTSGQSGAPPAAMPALESDLLDSREAGPAALRGSLLRVGGYVAGILLSLASAPLLIRHLGVSDFGRYMTVLALVTIVSGFTEGGLNSIVLREFATLDSQQRREMMRTAIGIRLVLTIVGIGLAVAFALAAGYDEPLVWGTLLAGAGLVLQLLQSLLSVTLQAQLRFGWASAADLLRQVVNVLLLVVLVLVGAGLLPLLAVAIPASAVSLVFTVPLVLRYTGLRPSFHLGRWWRLLRETIPWAVISAVNIVYFRLAIVLMSVIAAAVQTGYFATSFRVTEVLVGIPGLVVGAAFPILARSARDDRERFALASGRIFELSLLASVWLVLCVEVGASFAIHVLAAHKADPAIEVLRIQALAVIPNFVAVACGFPLLTLRRYRQVLFSNLFALVISAILTLALAPSLGARGAAIAAVVAEMGLGVSQAMMLKAAARDVALRPAAVAVPALAGVAGVATGLAVPVHPIVGVALATVVYGLVLKLLGRFPNEVRELLVGRITALVR